MIFRKIQEMPCRAKRSSQSSVNDLFYSSQSPPRHLLVEGLFTDHNKLASKVGACNLGGARHSVVGVQDWGQLKD